MLCSLMMQVGSRKDSKGVSTSIRRLCVTVRKQPEWTHEFEARPCQLLRTNIISITLSQSKIYEAPSHPQWHLSLALPMAGAVSCFGRENLLVVLVLVFPLCHTLGYGEP